MRNPIRDEADALDLVLLLAVVVLPIAIAIAIGPLWLVIIVVGVVLAGLAMRRERMSSFRRGNPDVHLRSAPPHAGPADERRILVVANESLVDDAFAGEVTTLASAPGANVLVLAPATISAGARLTGDVDRQLDRAQDQLTSALRKVPSELQAAGRVTEAEPLQAVEDAVSSFSPDEIVIATHGAPTAGGVGHALTASVRERFAVPVTELRFEPALSAS